EVNDGNAFHAFGGVAGHAGLFTTASDLTRLGRALLAALHGAGLWSAETVRLFTAPGEDPGQALGFRTASVGGERVVGHSGFPGAEFALLPDAGLVAGLLTNRLHTWGVVESIAPWWQRMLTVIAEYSEELACA
ncbi:MAG: serine hydrolase, partial [Streptosporangiales bacterium]